MRVSESWFLRLFYNPDSKIPLLFPLPLLILGQYIAHGFHLSMRLWAHGSIHFDSYRDLPKDGLIEPWDTIVHGALVYGVLGLAAVILILSAFSFKSWWMRIPYVLVFAFAGLIIAWFIGLSYICDTGIDCL
jgi:hypothetical protein